MGHINSAGGSTGDILPVLERDGLLLGSTEANTAFLKATRLNPLIPTLPF